MRTPGKEPSREGVRKVEAARGCLVYFRRPRDLGSLGLSARTQVYFWPSRIPALNLGKDRDWGRPTTLSASPPGPEASWGKCEPSFSSRGRHGSLPSVPSHGLAPTLPFAHPLALTPLPGVVLHGDRIRPPLVAHLPDRCLPHWPRSVTIGLINTGSCTHLTRSLGLPGGLARATNPHFLSLFLPFCPHSHPQNCRARGAHECLWDD